ncbi:MAG: amidohydrolase [Oscillospiraceae bacterium]
MVNFNQLAKETQEYVIGLRREFHTFPELSGKEIKTSARIQEELTKLNIPFEVVENYSVVGKICGGQPGKKVAIRGDIDALPVAEETDVPFKSQNPGVMHACGHDSHIAMLLGVGKILMQKQKELKGTVYLCFQLGEEVGGGVFEIIKYLQAQGGVDLAFGTHIMSEVPTGSVTIHDGATFAGGTGFQLEVVGRGGHGSSPWAAIDPIKPLCEILLRYTSMNINYFSPFRSVVISPCVIKGGDTANVIPEKAAFQGTIRFFNEDVYDEVKGNMEKIANEIAASYGATANLIMPQAMAPIINDAASVGFAKKVLEDMPNLQLYNRDPFMLSDNFAYLMKAFKGFYCLLGTGNPELHTDVAHHSPSFKLDEDSFVLGCEFMSSCAFNYLNEN